MTHKERARLQFATWLQQTHPDIFQKAIAAAANSQATLKGMGAEPTQSFWEKFTNAAMGLGTTYLSLKNQRDAMAINLERAKTGQPPIDMAASAPVVRTQVDVSPELSRQLISSAGEGLNKTLLLAGAGILGFLLIKKFA